jgi:hypothetical protein
VAHRSGGYPCAIRQVAVIPNRGMSVAWMGGWMRKGTLRAPAFAALLAVGCADIGSGPPSSVPQADGPDGGTLESNNPNDGGFDETCEFAAGEATDKLVRVIYLVPSDREENPRYVANLEQSVRHLQLWMRDRIPARTSFRTTDPVVEVVKTTHQASWYATNPNGNDPNLYYWYNGIADANVAAGAVVDDPENVWIIYLAADEGCGQATGAIGHFALLTENDMRGLSGVARVPICDGDASDAYGRCRWVGGMAIMLAYALGVPQSPGCADTDPATVCDDKLLTWLGYTTYPDATLTPDQVTFLGDNPFLRGTGLPDCSLDCAAAIAP